MEHVDWWQVADRVYIEKKNKKNWWSTQVMEGGWEDMPLQTICYRSRDETGDINGRQEAYQTSPT